MRKDFIAAEPCFLPRNMLLVKIDVVLLKADTFRQHATPIAFDGLPQFLQK